MVNKIKPGMFDKEQQELRKHQSRRKPAALLAFSARIRARNKTNTHITNTLTTNNI
jgi:hypothetical protein